MKINLIEEWKLYENMWDETEQHIPANSPIENAKAVAKTQLDYLNIEGKNPENLISFIFKGQSIINPWMDTTARFELTDTEAIETYGLENIYEFIKQANEQQLKFNEDLNDAIICKIQKGVNEATGGLYYNVFPTRNTKFFDDWNKYIKSDSQDVMHFETVNAAKEMIQEFCKDFNYNYSKIRFVLA